MPLATITDFLYLKNTLQNTNYSSKTIQKKYMITYYTVIHSYKNLLKGSYSYILRL